MVVSIKENPDRFGEGVDVAQAESNKPIEINSAQQAAIRLIEITEKVEFIESSRAKRLSVIEKLKA
jgi:hypothetical protein